MNFRVERRTVTQSSFLIVRFNRRKMPGVMEPTLESLELLIDRSEDGFDCGQCGISGGGGVEDSYNPGQVSSDRNQLIDTIELNRNQNG